MLNYNVCTRWDELTQTSVLKLAQLLAATMADRLRKKVRTRRALIADLSEEFEKGGDA